MDTRIGEVNTRMGEVDTKMGREYKDGGGG